MYKNFIIESRESCFCESDILLEMFLLILFSPLNNKKLDPIESSFSCGEYRIRTDDPLHAMQVL